MGCCGRTSTQGGEAGPASDEDFHGPMKKRGCTDVIFLLIFIAFLGGMGYVAYMGFEHNGDPNRFFYGVDSWGNTCSRQNKQIPNVSLSGQNHEGSTKTFYYNPIALLQPALFESTVLCVKACPNDTLDTMQEVQDFADSTGSYLCRYDVSPTAYVGAPDDNVKCPSLPVSASLSILNRCFPQNLMNMGASMLETLTDTALSQLNASNAIGVVQAQCKNSKDIVSNIVTDLQKTKLEILYLCAIAVGVSLLLTMLLRFFAALMIWVLVLGCALGSLAAAGFCWYHWHMAKQALEELPAAERVDQEKSVQNWLIFALVISGIGTIILVILIFLRKQIQLVVQLFHEAGKAMAKMPALLLQPIWTLLALIVLMCSLLYLFLYVMTAGDYVVDASTGFVSIVPNETLWYMRWYFVFGILWVSMFCFACQQLIIAGAVATWYFTRDKNSIGWPVLASLKRLIIYHLGTVAFGSFLIALVKFIRLILGYVQSKLKGRSSKLLKFILKCLQCCLWCFEKFLKFVNRNAYIMTAIYGSNFCSSAKKALVTIVANALRIGAINSVGAFCLFLGKMGVVAIVVIIGMEAFFKDNDELCYKASPLFAAGLFAFLLAHSFMEVYSMTIDTIFMCFCEDCSRNDGIVKPYFMSKGLMEYVDNAAQAKAALEAREAAGRSPKA